MRLSDAIALGRTIIKPKSGSYPTDTEGCALDMGMRATEGGNWHKSNRRWPWLEKECPTLPCNCFRARGWPNTVELNFSWAIIHLFDTHVFASEYSVAFERWSLDMLIDWVRSVEPQEETERSPEGTEVVLRHTAKVEAARS